VANRRVGVANRCVGVVW